MPHDPTESAPSSGVFDDALRDVRELGHLLGELERNRADLATAQRIAGMGSWTLIPDTEEVELSDEMLRQLFIDRSTWNGTLSNALAAIHPDDLHLIEEGIRQATEEGRVAPVEFRVVAPDGAIRWMFAQGVTEFDDDGRAVRVVGTAFDISERKAVEDDRRELVAHFVRTREAERLHVAAELQESTLQTLTAALLRIEALEGSSSDPAIGEVLRATTAALRATMESVRRLVFELYPTALEHGLGPALEDLASRKLAPRGVNVTIHDRTGSSLPRAVVTSAYRVLREALETLPAGAAELVVQVDGSDLRIEIRHHERLAGDDLERVSRAVHLLGGSLIADVTHGPRLLIEMSALSEVAVEP